MRTVLTISIVILIFAGCSREAGEKGVSGRGAGPAAGEARQEVREGGAEADLPGVTFAKINPVNASSSQLLSVEHVATPVEGQPVSYKYRWYVDRAPVSEAEGNTLDPQYFNKGSEVEVEVIATDGQREGQPFRSKAVTIRNSPPAVKEIELQPVPAFSGSRITAEPKGEDRDGDRMTFQYQWQVDSRKISGAEFNIFDTAGIKKKSMVSAVVTPFDGEDRGLPLQSHGLILSNRAPEITSEPPSGVTAKYEYQVAARDVDGDTLTFSLVTAPQGMVIHPSSGLLTWEMKPVAAREEVAVKIAVSDGDGGTAYQEYTLILEPR